MTRTEANELIKQSLTAEQLEEFKYQINSQQESIDDEMERFGECDTEVSDYVDVLIELTDKSDSDKTLCGQRVSREMDTDDGASCHDDCKKCRNAAKKLGVQ